jgi:hypothetical protein
MLAQVNGHFRLFVVNVLDFFFFLRELAYVKVQFGYLALSTMTPFWFSLLFRNLDQNNDLPQTCLNNIIEALLLLE